MHLTGLDLLFWAAGFLAHFTLLCVLFFRRRVKMFPFFTTLIAVDLCRSFALFSISIHWIKASYFYTFWSFGFLDTTLQLLLSTRCTPIHSAPSALGHETYEAPFAGCWS